MFFLFFYYTINNKNSQYVFKKYILLFTAFLSIKKIISIIHFITHYFLTKKFIKKNKLKKYYYF